MPSGSGGCLALDLPRYEATFDAIAGSLLRADPDPDGALQRFARGELTREEDEWIIGALDRAG